MQRLKKEKTERAMDWKGKDAERQNQRKKKTLTDRKQNNKQSETEIWG